MSNLSEIYPNDDEDNSLSIQKTRLVLPPITSHQRKSSFASQTTSTSSFDGETTKRFVLPSKQNPFLKSISEIS